MTQEEAHELFIRQKTLKNAEDRGVNYPTTPGRKSIDLVMASSPHPRHKQKFEVSLNGVNIRPKITFIYLGDDHSIRRLDLTGNPHRNPRIDVPKYLIDSFGTNMDSIRGQEISCPHIHVYTENFEDKWAIPLAWEEQFKDFQGEEPEILERFLLYCNITGIRISFSNPMF